MDSAKRLAFGSKRSAGATDVASARKARYRLRSRRRHQRTPDAHQQRIAQHLPQLRKPMTHRRLRDAEAMRGAGHAPLLEKRVQGDELARIYRRVHSYRNLPWCQ
jgi:hypothetical protein